MIYNKHSYTVINSSVLMTIIKIQFQNDEYIKFKGILSNKNNEIVYETKNYKLNKRDISHWIDIRK